MYVVGAEAYLRTKWHLDPSNRLATPTLQTDRQAGQTLLSDSIGRTILQTVGQKLLSYHPLGLAKLAYLYTSYVQFSVLCQFSDLFVLF